MIGRKREEDPSVERITNREQKLDLSKLVNSAVSEAVDIMAKSKPMFNRKFISNYVDPKAVNEYAEKIAPYIQEGKMTPEEAYQALASAMVSPDLLTEEGKQIIFGKSLEDKAGKWLGITPGSRKAKRVLEGERKLDEALLALKDVYNLIKSDEDYSKRMPEFTEAISKLYDLGFYNATVSTLYKRLPEDKYIALKEGIHKASRESMRTIENYIGQAAAVLLLIGVGVLGSILAANTITGHVIGSTNTENIPALIFGGVSLILGIYMWFRKK